MLIALVASALVTSAHATTPSAADSPLNPDGRDVNVRLHAEVGMIAPLKHTIQFGLDGTEIDYLKDAAQDNLFPLLRLSTDLDLGDRHTVVLLYQPLDLNSRAVLSRDLVVDGATFTKGSAVDFRYGFSFFRGSWLYDLAKSEEDELALGLSLQIRNATISFTSTDGETSRVNRDIGPVPILKVRGRKSLDGGYFIGGEADGFYAPVSYLNGDNNDVVGAILDASARGGLSLDNGAEAFLNLRYLGGGAKGQSDDPEYPGDGWTENWLHFATVSVGFTLR